MNVSSQCTNLQAIPLGPIMLNIENGHSASACLFEECADMLQYLSALMGWFEETDLHVDDEKWGVGSHDYAPVLYISLL